jgi:ATP synthase protein I
MACHDAPPPPPLETPRFEKLRKAFGRGEASLMAQASSVGLAFAVAIVLGLAAGWWLDRELGTAPWLLLGGLFIGIFAGFKNLFTVSARIEKMEQRRAEEKRKNLYQPPSDEA